MDVLSGFIVPLSEAISFEEGAAVMLQGLLVIVEIGPLINRARYRIRHDGSVSNQAGVSNPKRRYCLDSCMF